MTEIELGLAGLRLILSLDDLRVISIDAAIDPGFATIDFDDGQCLGFICGHETPEVAEAAFWALAALDGALGVAVH